MHDPQRCPSDIFGAGRPRSSLRAHLWCLRRWITSPTSTLDSYTLSPLTFNLNCFSSCDILNTLRPSLPMASPLDVSTEYVIREGFLDDILDTFNSHDHPFVMLEELALAWIGIPVVPRLVSNPELLQDVYSLVTNILLELGHASQERRLAIYTRHVDCKRSLGAMRARFRRRQATGSSPTKATRPDLLPTLPQPLVRGDLPPQSRGL